MATKEELVEELAQEIFKDERFSVRYDDVRNFMHLRRNLCAVTDDCEDCLLYDSGVKSQMTVCTSIGTLEGKMRGMLQEEICRLV